MVLGAASRIFNVSKCMRKSPLSTTERRSHNGGIGRENGVLPILLLTEFGNCCHEMNVVKSGTDVKFGNNFHF